MVDKEGALFHPLSELFPLMKNKGIEELAEDLRKHGLRIPITRYEGKILDGRNRYKACLVAGIEPKYIDYEGDDPTSYVVSHNLKRRNLSKGQRAVIAAKILTRLEEEARQRQGARTDIVEKFPPSKFGKSRDQAGELLGVSGRYISDVKVIEKEAPEKIREIQSGEKTVSQVKREIRGQAFTDQTPNLGHESGERLWKLQRTWEEAKIREKEIFANWIFERGESNLFTKKEGEPD